MKFYLSKSMPLHVQWQVIWSWESSLTNIAFERLVTSVFAEMTGQLIRSCKSPSAAFPCTHIRFLTWWRNINVWSCNSKSKKLVKFECGPIEYNVEPPRAVYLYVFVCELSGVSSLCRLYCNPQSHTCVPASSFLGL